jgi:hypothetical protein
MSKMMDMMIHDCPDDKVVSSDRIFTKVKIKDRSRFLSMINATADACAKNDSVPVLQSIKFMVKKSIPKRMGDGSIGQAPGNALFLIGGNGTRTLVIGEASFEGAADGVVEADSEVNILIPAKNLPV